MRRIAVLGVIAAILCMAFVSYRSSNNVCTTFDDYYSDRDNNKNCYHNPDHDLDVPDIVRRHGYPVEEHHVTTQDGYILTLFRIPHQKNATTDRPGKPVFLQHGLGSNSGCFINRGQKSLGLILANNGYDVWLGNFRGTIYSRNHTHLQDSQSEFWEFSFHEHGLYDLRAQIDLVSNITNQKITYIGYSQGTMAMYVYSIVYAEEAHKQIDMFVNLAPSALLKNSKSILKHFFRNWHIFEPVIRLVTGGQFFARIQPSSVLKYLCYPFPFQMKLCQIPEMLLFGFSYGQNDPETLPVSLLHNADWISVKQLSHITQLLHLDDFRQYNYGEDNMRVYGTSEPPIYDFSKMLVPTYFIRAQNDLVTTKENVENLYNALPERIRPHDIYVIPDEEFSHLDFVSGRDAVPLLYNHITEFLGKL